MIYDLFIVERSRYSTNPDIRMVDIRSTPFRSPENCMLTGAKNDKIVNLLKDNCFAE